MTGLLCCLYVKLFLPSLFNSADFWSSLSCIVLDIGLADKTVIKELGGFIDGKAQGYSFSPPKLNKPTKQTFWCTRNLHRNVWNSGLLDYSELSNILPRAVKDEYFTKRTEKCKIHDNLSDKEVENLRITAVPNLKISLMKKFGFAWVNYSDTRLHFTVQSVKQSCLVTG